MTRTATGRLLKSTQSFFHEDSTFIHSPIRDVLKVLYPDHESKIYTVETLKGLRYVLRIMKEVPDTEELIN